MSLTARVAYRAVGGRYGDHRDWLEIGSWVDGIADALPAWRHFDVMRWWKSAAEVE
jgi:hypothetical protein